MKASSHPITLALISSAMVTIASCSTGAGSITPAMQPASLHTIGEQASVPNVAGTYVGTWKQTGGGKPPETGTVTVTLHQSASKISGKIAAKYKSHTYDLSLTGTVKAAGKGASLQFTVKSHLGNGKGNGTVLDSKLTGTIIFPAHGSVPKTTITLTASKKN